MSKMKYMKGVERKRCQAAARVQAVDEAMAGWKDLKLIMEDAVPRRFSALGSKSLHSHNMAVTYSALYPKDQVTQR
jgi:hypothetical protein